MSSVRDLPSAVRDERAFLSMFEGRTPAVFLDYDGTLVPIAPRPEDAVLPQLVRERLALLARRLPLAVVTGRDLRDVRSMLGIEGIAYAGSHGFEILTPDGRTFERGTGFLPSIDQAERELRASLVEVPGAQVERKRFGVAVHYRLADDSLVPVIDRRVAESAARHPDLRRTGGKKIFELLPGMKWNKGEAVVFLLEALGLDRPDVFPIYLGDDETDEDAFQAVRARGVGIVVGDTSDDRPTAAAFRLSDPDEVVPFLERLGSRDPPVEPTGTTGRTAP